MAVPRPLIVLAALLGIAHPALSGTISGTVTCTGLRSNANAVVYIEKIAGKTFKAPEKHILMNQKAKEFVPAVLPILVGTTVDFPNGDPFLHNVFTPDDCGDKFNLGSLAQGEVRSHTFAKPCAAVMLCKIHPEMVAYVLAIETPYFAVTDAEGKYTISGVPDHTYQVSVWQERLKKQTRQVIVNGASTADFKLSR
jgi:plastocyanin